MGTMTVCGRPRVLVAEHQALIGMWLEDVLTEAGYAVDGPYGSCEAAIIALRCTRPDYAVVSIDLSQGSCFTLACTLRRAHVPFMLFSGSEPVLSAFRDVPMLDRPCLESEVIASLPQALQAQNRHRQQGPICPRADRLLRSPPFALDQCPPACGA